MNRWIGLVFVCGIALFLLTFIPLATRAHRAGSSSIDILIHADFIEDYESYLSAITQGQNGSFFFTNPYYIEHLQPLPLFTLYTTAGLLSGPFHIWPPYVYHILRGIGVLFALLATYTLLRQFVRSNKSAAIATIVSLFITNPPEFLFRQDIAKSFLPWWDGRFSMYGRINALPHHLFAQAFLTLAISYYIRFITSNRRLHFFISMLLISLAIYTIPQTAFPCFCVCVAGETIRLFKKLHTHLHVSILQLIIYIACIAIPALSLLHMSLATSDPLWKANRIWEINYWNRDPWVYYHGYLTTAFLFIPAIAAFITALKARRTPVTLLLGVWALSPIIAYPLLPVLGVGTERIFEQPFIFIPICALSVIAVRDLIKKSDTKKVVIAILCLLLFLWGALDTEKNINVDVTHVTQEPISDKYYTPKTVYDTAVYIKKSLPPKSIVLATPQIGSLIVSFAPVYTYIGKQTHGSNWDLDTTEPDRFFNQQMSSSEAAQWVNLHHIRYVVSYITLSYPFLRSVWSNSDMLLYKIISSMVPLTYQTSAHNTSL